MGGRLRYRDAIALWESLSADPSTYCGMSAVHMVLPMDATAIIAEIQTGDTSFLGDLAPDNAKRPKHVEVTEEEKRAAEASMSSLFGFKKTSE